ncbi:cupin domain-containing protein [Arenibaculum sp.]|jgi:quercetin dioxygenase-like cupin family protein|uniref:cupin domain-containing protein n=1 Tax=Arenibaculum sp. TaxID=2865862 RepID=UPI002E0FAE6F|nr:cupin domain-containing protein [Arenibaculum sp.]
MAPIADHAAGSGGTVGLAAAAAALPERGWSSLILGRVANTRVKLFRVDPEGLPEEVHPGWAEALIMIEGEMRMELDGVGCTLKAGDCIRIPENVRHAILPGGHGAFLLVDPDGLV